MTTTFWLLALLYALALTTSLAALETFSILLFLNAVFLFVKQFRAGDKFPKIKIGGDIWVIGFFAALAVSAILSPSIASAEDRVAIIGWSRWLLIIYGLCFVFQKNVSKLPKLIDILLIFATLVAVYGCLQFFTGYDVVRPYDSSHMFNNFWRARGFFSSTMTYSSSMGMLVCLSWARVLVRYKNGHKLSPWLLISTSIISLSLVLTITRGVWVALFISFLLMLFVLDRKLTKKIVPILFSILIVLFFSLPVFRERVQSMADLNNLSNIGRLQVWQLNYEMFKDRPILGHGYKYSEKLIPVYVEKMNVEKPNIPAPHPHNSFLQVLSGMGLLGIVFFLGWMLSCLKTSLYLFNRLISIEYSEIALGAFGAFIVLNITGLTQCSFASPVVTHMFVFIFSMLMALLNNPKLYSK